MVSSIKINKKYSFLIVLGFLSSTSFGGNTPPFKPLQTVLDKVPKPFHTVLSVVHPLAPLILKKNDGKPLLPAAIKAFAPPLPAVPALIAEQCLPQKVLDASPLAPNPIVQDLKEIAKLLPSSKKGGNQNDDEAKRKDDQRRQKFDKISEHIQKQNKKEEECIKTKGHKAPNDEITFKLEKSLNLFHKAKTQKLKEEVAQYILMLDHENIEIIEYLMNECEYTLEFIEEMKKKSPFYPGEQEEVNPREENKENKE